MGVERKIKKRGREGGREKEIIHIFIPDSIIVLHSVMSLQVRISLSVYTKRPGEMLRRTVLYQGSNLRSTVL